METDYVSTFDEHSIMCPSMKVSKSRVFSPKGRAAMDVREWLRLIANENVSLEQLDFRKNEIKLITALVKRLSNTVPSWRRAIMIFLHELKAAMDSCLACKACAIQCPIKIDVPSLRTEILSFYHIRFLRPAKTTLWQI